MATNTLPRPTFSQAVLLGMIVFCCTVDSSRLFQIAGVSGLGAGTLAAGGAVWAAWMLRPVLPKGLLVILLPLMLFQIDALGTLLWYKPGMDGVQLAVIGLTFLGVLMLTARETYTNPRLAPVLHRVIVLTSLIPVLSWLFLILTPIERKNLNVTRPFALYTLTVIAVTLAGWYAINRPGSKRKPSGGEKMLPVLWVAIITFTVMISLSRTALVGILLLVPLSVAIRGSRKGIWQAGLILALGIGVFLALINYDQALKERFFGEDAHLKVAGISFNGSGRSAIWNLLFQTIGDDWVCGKGLSASEDIINRYFTGVGHPHNDYLRFYYDQGIVGLLIWLVFLYGLVHRMSGDLRRSIRDQSDDYPMHLAGLLALAGVGFSMLTDNSVCYTFVMAPLALVMGCSLGTGAAAREHRGQLSAGRTDLEANFPAPVASPALLAREARHKDPVVTGPIDSTPEHSLATEDAHG